MQKFPHFQTPLSSMRQIKEAIHHRKHTQQSQGQQSFYADPNSVNQSVAVIRLFEFILDTFKFGSDENTIFVFFCVLDVLIIAVQLKIIDLVWMKKKRVRDSEIATMMLIVFCNPLQLSSVCAQNVGIIKDLLVYVCIYAFLLPSKQALSDTSRAALIGVTLYVDPSSWSLQLGLLLCDPGKRNLLLQLLMSIGIAGGLMMLPLGCSVHEQIQNMKNIIFLQDHSENVGLYFYICIEVFKQHVDFFLYAYVLYTFIAVLQVQQMVSRAYTVIALCSEYDKEKYEKRMFRAKCLAVFLCTFIKVLLNQYPLLTDLQFIVFTLACCNMRCALKHIEGRLLITYALVFSIINSMILFNTWLDRFSGNANFFYFQTIVYNLFLIVIFIQAFQAINTKVKK